RGEPRVPEAEAAHGHGEGGEPDLPRARPAARYVREGKVCHHRAGGAVRVAVIEVVDARLVEIDCLLDPAHPERLGEEAVVAGGIARHDGVVVQALDLVAHRNLLSRVGSPLCRLPDMALFAAT